MAVSFTNNWKNILDKLRNVLRTEYRGAVAVYVGDEETTAGNQFIRVEPERSDLIEQAVTQEVREFTVNIFYVFSGVNVKKASLDNILRFVSRTEALVHDNTTMTLSDSSVAYNCRIESTELGTDEEETAYVVSWVWKCLHRSNLT